MQAMSAKVLSITGEGMAVIPRWAKDITGRIDPELVKKAPLMETAAVLWIFAVIFSVLFYGLSVYMGSPHIFMEGLPRLADFLSYARYTAILINIFIAPMLAEFHGPTVIVRNS